MSLYTQITEDPNTLPPIVEDGGKHSDSESEKVLVKYCYDTTRKNIRYHYLIAKMHITPDGDMHWYSACSEYWRLGGDGTKVVAWMDIPTDGDKLNEHTKI